MLLAALAVLVLTSAAAYVAAGWVP